MLAFATRRALLLSFATIFAAAAYAQDFASLNPEKLSPPLNKPLKLLATTAMSGKGQDFFTLKPKQTAVVGTITGPAVICRVWSTSSKSAMVSLDVTVDGKKQTLYEKGKPVGLGANHPLRTMDKQAYWSYVPLGVRQKAVFTARSIEPTEEIKFYLQVGYRAVSAAELKLVGAKTVSGMRAVVGKLMGGAVPVAQPGTVATNRLSLDGAYTVDGPKLWTLEIAPPADATIEQLQATRLTLTCDGSKTVDVPMGAMFGQYWQVADYRSAGTSVAGKHLFLQLPVPVAQSMTVGLAKYGRGALSWVDLVMSSTALPAAPKYHLYAQYFSQVSVKDQPLTLLSATGPGLFVGSNLAVDGGPNRRTFAFLEGNEQLYVDGATTPSIEGTGTEDYFNNSWYFETGQLGRPFHGVTFIQPKDPPRVVAYRWMIPDCVPFKTSLKFDLQHGSRNGAPGVLYRGVMFWYQQGQANVAEPVEAKLTAAEPAGGKTDGAGGGVTPGVIGGSLALVLIVIATVVMRRRRGG